MVQYGGNVEIATEDEEGAILALKQYNRVRCVRLQLLVTSLQKLIVAMEDWRSSIQFWNT